MHWSRGEPDDAPASPQARIRCGTADLMTRALRFVTRPKEAAKLLLKVLVSGGLVALVIYKTEATGVAARLLGVNVPAMLLAAALMAGLAILPALRWKILVRLSGMEFSLANLYELLMISNFMAQAIPSIGADGVRAWYLHRHGMWLAAAVSSILMDRLIALASLLLMSFVSLPWLWNIVSPPVLWWMGGLIVIAVIGALTVLHGFDWLPAGWANWRIMTMARHLSGACRMLLKEPRALLEVIILSVAVHLLVAVFVYALSKAVRVQIGLAECILLIPLVMLVATIPVGIAGWGIREGTMVVAFGFLNMPAADALLVSILFGIVVAVSSTPGLVFWLMKGRELTLETAPKEA